VRVSDLTTVSPWHGTTAIMREVVRSTRTLMIRALPFLASLALAAPRALHHRRRDDPWPPADPVRRRHAGGLDLEPDPAALGHHDRREPPKGLHGAAEPGHLAGGGAVPLRMGGGRFSLFESRRIRRAQMTQRHRSMSEGWHLILMWVLLFCLPSLARGGWTEGLEAFDLGNYATAYREFLPLALQGDAKAQFGIGAMYYDGLDRPQDHVQAVKWFSLAAAQGLAVAQYLLGTQYRKGQGVPQDYAQALIWFHLAAVQGEANAQYELGDMHFDGQGIPQDYVQALMWFRKAADQGQSHAQVMLDSMYEIGHGVPQDYVQAATWSRKAAEQGEAIAYLALGLMYTAGRGVP
jgi:hypothetical protein